MKKYVQAAAAASQHSHASSRDYGHSNELHLARNSAVVEDGILSF